MQEINSYSHSFSIRKADIVDWQLLQQIGKDTFYETFAPNNTDEDMQKYLQENFTESKIKMQLQDQYTSTYLALYERLPIGYLKVNFGPAQTELQDERSLEIERIYVLKQWQGKGVAKELFNKALDIAHNCKLEYIWLGVWEHNPRAIRFYEKNGFVAFDKHIFRLGTDEQTDILMKRILK